MSDVHSQRRWTLCAAPSNEFSALSVSLLACCLLAGCSQKPPEAPAGMVYVPRSRQVLDAKVKPERVQPFFADRCEVTNREFERFVTDTGYVTDAEKIGDSVCFIPSAGPLGEPIFELIVGATWRRPEGPESSLEGRLEHPVVHVSWRDASAYAAWCGKRLPTRAEWYAMARGEAADQAYPFGDELEPGGVFVANTWQGLFPIEDEGRDGFVGTAPVGSFPPGTHGLMDLGGNVWEWTNERSYGFPAGCDPALVPQQDLAATRGGSYLCRERAAPPFHACRGYRIGSVEYKPLTDGNNQVGFRCVRDT